MFKFKKMILQTINKTVVKQQSLINISNFKLPLFFLIISVISCKPNTETETENLKKAKQEVVVANNELLKAKKDSINQYANYRAEIENRLIENEKQIASIRMNIKNEKASIRTKLEKDLDVIMTKNEALRIEFKNQKDSVYSKWERFKFGFNLNGK